MDQKELEKRIEGARRWGLRRNPYYVEAVVALADELAAEREKVRNLEAALVNAQPIGERCHEVSDLYGITGRMTHDHVGPLRPCAICGQPPEHEVHTKHPVSEDDPPSPKQPPVERIVVSKEAARDPAALAEAMQYAARLTREHSIQFPGPEGGGIDSLAQNQVDPKPEVTEFIEQNFFELIDAPANPGPGVDECLSMQGAPTQAEVDAIRAEVERLREERDEVVNDVGEWCECVHEAGGLLGVRPGDEVRPGVLAKIRELIADRERITIDRDNLVVMYNTAHAAADEARKERDEARAELADKWDRVNEANESRDEAWAAADNARIANGMLAEEILNLRERLKCHQNDNLPRVKAELAAMKEERDAARNELTAMIEQYDADERSRQQQYAYQYDCQRAEIDNLRELLLDCVCQACEMPGGYIDHQFISAYEAATKHLVCVGILTNTDGHHYELAGKTETKQEGGAEK